MLPVPVSLIVYVRASLAFNSFLSVFEEISGKLPTPPEKLFGFGLGKSLTFIVIFLDDIISSLTL